MGFVYLKNIEIKLKKYDIRLVHFIPGRIRLQSARWTHNVALAERILKELRNQPFVFSLQFTATTGSIVITYDAKHVTNNHELESWFQILNKVYTTEFSK